MAVELTKDRTVIPLQLQPRLVPYEPTPEQAAEALARSNRRALVFLLREMFAQAADDDDNDYRGPMTTHEGAGSCVERRETIPALGHKLHPLLVEWMADHNLPDPTDQRRYRLVLAALARLRSCHPDLYDVVIEHGGRRRRLRLLARLWGQDRGALGRDYVLGLNSLLGYLGEGS